MRPTRSVAGAALPETALVISLFFLILIGAIRLAAVSYNQIAVDGAAFTYARLSGAGDTLAATKTVGALPQITAGDITTKQGLPPAATIPTDYNIGDATNRHGGASLMLPIQIVTHVLKSNLDGILLGGNTLSVNGFSVAPSYEEFLSHDNVESQGINSIGSFNSANNYFTAGGNTPPYFVGFHYIETCSTSLTAGSWSTCPDTVEFNALGMAEYLDHDNWNRADPGVAGPNAMFSEMYCHQVAYANVAATVYAADTRAAAESVLTMSDANISKIYSWDSVVNGGYPPDSYVPGDYPLNPGGGC